MNVRIYRCKQCGKRLAPWTPMCDNCRRLTPAVLVWGAVVGGVGIAAVLKIIKWAAAWPPG